MTAKIKLNAASGGGSVSLKAPSTTTSNAAVELQLPVADGSADQFIKTDGSGNLSFAAAGGGKILQVVSTAKTDTASASVAANTFSDLGISDFDVDITPASSSNKILISGFVNVSKENAGFVFIQLTRGGSALTGATGDASGIAPRATAAGHINNVGHLETIPFQYLDSPSSTSQLTYSVKFRHDAGSTKNVTLNRTYENQNNGYQPRNISVITAMEVAG